jgi:hypothetical protein
MNEKQLLPSESFPPIIWKAVFSDETTATSADTSWASFADLVQIDGVSLHLSRMPISQVTVAHGSGLYSLLIEDGACCFGFHRWRMPIGGERKDAEWMYSAFGFFRETERIILQITETSGRMLVQKRETPFLL